MHSLGLETAKRFEVVRKIGEGATSRVFEVVDRRTGGRFALKRLRAERLSSDRIARFKDEFRELERIEHPNLAKVYELVSDEHGTSLLMELVEGENFLRHVRPPPASLSEPTQPTGSTEDVPWPRAPSLPAHSALELGKLRAALAQLVLGVRALHHARKIHCDLKPENVLVNAESRLVIVDYGLVTEARREDHWRGTPAFMAPEQFEGVFAESVDWYAVGVLLYSALSGRLPVSESPSLMRNFARPLDPRVYNPGLPDDLVELSLRLLEPRADDRPGGADIARTLGLVRPMELVASPPMFVGREPELDRLRENFAAALTRGLRIVHVHGESGIGKSALMQQFALSVERSGGLAIRGASYRDAAVPYKGLDSVIDRIAASSRRLEIAIDAEDRAILGTIFPVLRMERGDEGSSSAVEQPDGAERSTAQLRANEARLPGVPLNPTVLRLRVIDALRRLLTRIAEPSGLALCIDDLQWSDSDSIEMLSELVDESSLPRVLLVVGYRSRGSEFGARAQHVRASLARDDELALGPLAEPALRSIVEATGERDAHEVQTLVHESGGNPFFMGELLRERRQHLARESLTIEEVIANRLRRLPSGQRAYLELVAVAGRPIEEATVWRALGARHEQALACSRALVAQSFVRMAESETQAVEAYHDRIREVVAQQLAGTELRARHAALALAYEQDDGAHPEVLAVHFRAAGDGEKALLYTERAGDAAVRALAFDHAASLYDEALALLPRERASRFEALRSKLAGALSSAGRPSEAAHHLRLLLEHRPGDVDLLLHTGDELLKAGEVEEGLLYLSRVADAVGEPLPTSRALAMLKLVWNWFRLRRRVPERTIETSDLSEQVRRRLAFSLTIMRQLVWLDYVRSAFFALRHLRLSLDSGSRTDILQGLLHKASFVSAAPAWFAGGVPEAERLVRHAHALVRPTDDAVIRGVLRFTVAAAVDFARGHFRAAGVAFDEALEILRDNAALRRHWNIAFCQCGVLENLRMEGDLREIRRRLQLFKAEAKGHRILEAVHALRGGVLLALAEDDPARARALVNKTMAVWPETPTRVPHYYAAFARVEIALYEREPQVARTELPAARKMLAHAGLDKNSYYYLVQLVLEVRVALASGARSAAARGIRRLLRRPETWARAVGTALRGCLSLQLEQASAAARDFASAVPALQQCDLVLYAAAANVQLARSTGEDSERANEALSSHEVRAPQRLASYLLPCP